MCLSRSPANSPTATTTRCRRCVCVELPDAPAEVQVEAGPQHGTLLVMWLPVKVTERSCTAAITGYSVYVDGRRVKDLHSPTGIYVPSHISSYL